MSLNQNILNRSYKKITLPEKWEPASLLEMECDSNNTVYILQQFLKTQFPSALASTVTTLAASIPVQYITQIKNGKYNIQPNPQQYEQLLGKLYRRLEKYEANSKNEEQTSESINKEEDKVNEIKQFLKKLKLTKEERRKTILELQKKEQNKIHEVSAASEESIKKKKEEEMQQRREVIQNRLKSIEERANERKKSLQSRKLEKVVKQKYLYKELEEDYKKNESEIRKKQTEEANQKSKERYKPLDKSDLESHSKMVDMQIKAHEEEMAKQVLNKKMDTVQRQHTIQKLKTRVTEKITQDMEKEKSYFEQIRKEKRDLKKKMKAYAHIIKETIVPSISEEKVQERIQKMDSIHTKKRDGKSIKELPDYLKMVRGSAKLNRSAKNFESPDEQLSFPSIYKDYLKDQREKRANEISKKQNNWESVLKDNQKSSIEKFNEVINTANLLETKANRDEKLIRINGKKDIDKSVKASDMFIDAIKAKLALLDEM